MAKTETTVRGYVYTVTSPNGGTVTDAEGKLSKTVDAGDQITVQAPSDSLSCDDDDAVIYKTNFNEALAALGLLGGGADKLPAGYVLVAYLQPAVSTASFDSDFYATPDLGCRARGFFDTSRASLFPRDWFLFISDQLYWTSLCYYLPKNAIGYRDNNKVLYPQQDELPDVESGGNVTKGCPISGNFQVQYNWLGEKKWTYMDADKTLERTQIGVGRESYPQKVYLLGRGPESLESWSGGVRDVLFSKANRVVSHIVPVLNQQGQPAMWDLIRKQSLKKAGEGYFIVGITHAAQLRTVLRKLPDLTGQDMGSLTLSIPAEANTPEMQDLLDTTETQKNWELTIQERAAEVATYSLRRVRKVVWVRRVQSEHGSYVDADGERWLTEWCSAIYSPLGNDPTLHGYEPFDSVEQAVEAWGLQPYQYLEDELLNETE